MNNARKRWDIAYVATIGVVLSIVLLIVLFPVYTDGRSMSPKSRCISNSKQVILSMIMYASDCDDLAPPDFTFDSAKNGERLMADLMPYCKQPEIFLCPQEIKKKGGTINQEGIAGKIDYVHCLSLRGVIPDFSTGKRLLKLTSVKNPEVVPYMRDPIRGYGTSKGVSGKAILSPHGSGFVVSFIDGHVKFRDPIALNLEL